MSRTNCIKWLRHLTNDMELVPCIWQILFSIFEEFSNTHFETANNNHLKHIALFKDIVKWSNCLKNLKLKIVFFATSSQKYNVSKLKADLPDNLLAPSLLICLWVVMKIFSIIITNVIILFEQGKPGVVSCFKNKMHGFDTGDHVTFREINGMTALNGWTCQIKGGFISNTANWRWA